MTSVLERDLIASETTFWEAMKARDTETAARMTSDQCVVAGAQGVSVIDSPTMATLLANGSWTLQSYGFEDVRVTELGDDTALLGYKVTEHLTVDGQPLTVQAYDVTGWTKRDGAWRCFLHTESLAGDPFGRDRTAWRARRQGLRRGRYQGPVM